MEANYMTYSCNLSVEMSDELQSYAKKINKKESEIIEDVRSLFLKERIKEDLADTFQRLKDDPEQKFLAEAGLGDFLK